MKFGLIKKDKVLWKRFNLLLEKKLKEYLIL